MNLFEYISKIRPVGVDYVIQEYINFECELAVLYYRFPGDVKGKITSICIKEFLSITGDGVTTMRGLIEKVPRARFQLPALDQKYGAALNNILPSGEKKMLVPIGNHRLGTTFLNGADLIDEQLTSVFDKISLQIEGMYYGRFDMRCKDLDSLREGKTLKILEYNGVGSDPAHIYQPGYSFFRACRDVSAAAAFALSVWAAVGSAMTALRRDVRVFMMAAVRAAVSANARSPRVSGRGEGLDAFEAGGNKENSRNTLTQEFRGQA